MSQGMSGYIDDTMLAACTASRSGDGYVIRRARDVEERLQTKCCFQIVRCTCGTLLLVCFRTCNSKSL
jgi:hypothetical protein